MGEQLTKMSCQQFVGLFRLTLASAGLAAIECLGRGEQRPSPTVFLSVLVGGIDKVLRHNAALHLQSCDIAVELTAHSWTVETACRPQLTGNETAMFLERKQDGFLYRPFFWHRIFVVPIVIEVGPPLTADKPGLLVEELTVDKGAAGHDGTLPLPQRPVPASVGKHYITSVGTDHLLG